MKKIPLSLAAVLSLALAAPAFSQTVLIDGLSHPESVVMDGDLLYVADIGKEMEPLKKDGDGTISTYHKDGKLIKKAFIKGIDAPKGLAIQGDMLVACDVDQLRVFDKKTGKQLKAISFEGSKTKFLNDFVFIGPNVGFLTATDINTVFKVFLESGQSTPLKLADTLRGPNGLAYSRQGNILMLNEYGGANGEKGRVLEISLDKGNAVRVITGAEGGLDGMAITSDGSFLVSDWGDVPRGRVFSVGYSGFREVTSTPVSGPADFAHDAASKTIYLPAMLEGKVYKVSY